MKKFRILMASLAVFFGMMAIAPTTSATDVFSGACGSGSGGSAVCGKQSGSNPLTGPNGTLRRVTRIIAVIAGIAAVIMILIGSIMYVTSGGDAGKVSSAKDTIMYAAVGLVIISIAQAIITFVIGKL
jgi:hypothetical protein